ncbi:uncharacterized protein LOC110844184 [Folsomia candida]|uniref:Uncharacterized protein n=1 Tax=Folsomia candida TaxID=158441 RepID=A0A226EN03_FOLCA|nr:uncharacterized protein LOC110844184 [Folsomia candida]OXA59012.1 hypothetical protein Fcan01_05867 [Folsomia candida]
MCDECYCCGPSWVGTVNTIAAFDLFTAAIHVVGETASIGVSIGLLMPFDSTKEMRNNCSEIATNNSDPKSCPWLYNYSGLNNYYVHLDFDTFVVTLLILIVFGGFIVEGYLFSTLRRGSTEKIHKECKKWLYYRLLILTFVTAGSFLKYWLQVYYPPIDGLLDCFKIYRIFSLIIVYKFMNELAYTVGVIYIKPPKRAKRGSL